MSVENLKEQKQVEIPIEEVYVVIRDMSAGNESVGEMWQETKIFTEKATLKEVMEWACGKGCEYSSKRVVITKPHK